MTLARALIGDSGWVLIFAALTYVSLFLILNSRRGPAPRRRR